MAAARETVKRMEAQDTSEQAASWFAAQVWVGRESLAASHLESRGYRIFCPKYRDYRRWSDRVKRTDRALFGGYLFCQLHGDVFGKVLTAPYVIRIVGDGERPLPIPSHEIEALRRVVDANVEVAPWPYRPRVGERVRVAVGPLSGTEGVVQRTKGRDRLIISVSLLMRSVAVEVDAASIGMSPVL